MSTITPSCHSPGGLVSAFLQVKTTTSSSSMYKQPSFMTVYELLDIFFRNASSTPCYRWTGNIPRPAKLCRSRDHVHILWADCHGTQIPEVPVVEEVPHNHPAGMSNGFLYLFLLFFTKTWVKLWHYKSTTIFFICFVDSVCYGDQPHLPVFLHKGLPIPVPNLRLHHRPVRADFLVSLPQLLVPCLHQGQETAKGPSGSDMVAPHQRRHEWKCQSWQGWVMQQLLRGLGLSKIRKLLW